MSAHSYIYVTIFYFLNYLFFKKNKKKFFLKMMLTYHISHEKIFSTALYVHGRSGVKLITTRYSLFDLLITRDDTFSICWILGVTIFVGDYVKCIMIFN